MPLPILPFSPNDDDGCGGGLVANINTRERTTGTTPYTLNILNGELKLRPKDDFS